MNFFQAQDRARHNTMLLVVLFIAAVTALVLSVYAVLFIVLQGNKVIDSTVAPDIGSGAFDGIVAAFSMSTWFDPTLFLYSSGGVLSVVAIGSMAKIVALSGGGSAVAESMNGSPVLFTTRDPAERRLLNIVEEMSIASGTPMPQVYLIPDEGINAFAAGTKISNAAIGVTRGALRHFNREQMQGVIAHEFSHIINGDMRMNIRLISIISGIMLLGILGHYAIRGVFYSSLARSNSRSKGQAMMAGLAIGVTLLIVGFVGTFFGNWIRAAVSRQREFLADAAAVQFTRNPEGIASALQRIGKRNGVLEDKHAAEYAHLFFAHGAALGFSNLFASHPPLEQRIRRVIPNWDGSSRIGLASPAAAEEPRADKQARGAGGVNQAFAAASPLSAAGLAASAVAAQVGTISPAAVAAAQTVCRALPPRLHNALEDSYSARALIYAMLLDRKNDSCRAMQLSHLQQNADTGVYDLVVKLSPDVAALSRRSCLPLMQCALPTLKQMSSSQRRLFIENMAVLIAADQEVELFEWSIQAVLTHVLNNGHTARADANAAAYALSMLARAGQTEADAAAAFAAATTNAGFNVNFVSDAFEPRRLFVAAQKLANAKPQAKKMFVTAAIACVTHSGVVNEDEEALLRAFLMILECPLPALLNGN